LLTIHTYGQTDVSTGNNKNAKDNFTLGNFKGALDEYLLLIKSDSNNVTYNFRIGICYLYTNIDKSKAIYYLERAVTNSKVDPAAWYELGHAYMLNNSLDKAIEYFGKYVTVTNGKENFEISSNRMIQMCEEAKKQIKNPINVTVENLGPEVNSAGADFNPYVPSDESFLVFSSKRSGNTGNLLDFDGYITSDVYISYQKYDKWLKAKGIGNTINSELVEETAGLSPDGTKLFVYCDNYNVMGQAMLSERKGKAFQKPDFLGDNINSIKLVSSATISPNKKILVFACDKNSSSAGMDLYMAKKLPSGSWGVPENLGAVINTVYDEDFPYFAADGKTLYFSSQGHESMGGYDIFKTVYDEKSNTWSEPVNIGYPVNTTDDDMTISFSASGRHAYISSLRKGGYGDLDIYKVIFNDVDPAYTVLTGSLVNKDSVSIYKVATTETVIDSSKTDTSGTEIKDKKNKTNLKNQKDAAIANGQQQSEIKTSIQVTDKTTSKVFGNYLPNKTSGKFLIILPPGDYELAVNADGYEKYTEIIKVFDRSVNSEIAKDIVLTPSEKDKKN
jgi:hypothetical protein